MAKTLDSQTVSEPKTSQGMFWIGKTLEEIAKSIPVPLESWTWQIDPAAVGGRLYSLIVVGSRRKRVVKLFNKQEIDLCRTDRSLQGEIRARLTKILTFLGPNQ